MYDRKQKPPWLAPPMPPVLPPQSLPIPSVPPHSGYPTTTTAVEMIATIQNDHPIAPVPVRNLSSHSPVPWSTGLFDCFSDINTCCLTCWCPCVTFGRIAEIVDRGSISCGTSAALYVLILCLTGCSCLYSCFHRSKLRGQHFLEERPCSDCCVHCFCEECALCQEYRELKNLGFDMHLGWHGNIEWQKRGSAAAPPLVHDGMTR